MCAACYADEAEDLQQELLEDSWRLHTLETKCEELIDTLRQEDHTDEIADLLQEILDGLR